MSRIQEILRKAEREGTVHRTRALTADAPATAAALAEPPPGRSDAPMGHADAPPVSIPAITVGPPAATALPVREVTGGIDHRLVAAVAPQSPAAEQYRSLRTRLARSENGRAVRAIIVTSPNKGDGKTLSAANLALTMAQEFQQRVLLI